MEIIKISKDQKREVDLALRTLLKLEYEKRLNVNPAFSLRAFARKLHIQQDLLSKLLNGKRGFSFTLTEKICDFLGITTHQILKENQISYSAHQYSFIEEDEFQTLSHWSNFAVIETLKLKGAKHTADFIASKLNLPLTQVNFTLERLERQGYIKKEKKKYQITRSSTQWLSKDKTSAARKKYQKELLEEAIQSIEDVDFAARDNSSLLFALDSKLMPEIKEKITAFRRGLDKFIIENSKDYDQVYNLSVALFPISETNLKNKKNKKKETS
ncbi:MAG: TIGR02147 family protein [Bdellovibrionota bacterium]